MNKLEHLLVVLMEECSEVQKECAKSLRFGINSKAPNDVYSNIEKIGREFSELEAVRSMISEIDLNIIPDDHHIIFSEKIKRVKLYMEYAKKVGTIREYEELENLNWFEKLKRTFK